MNPRIIMNNGKESLKKIIIENIEKIGANFVNDIMNNYDSLNGKNKFKATDNVKLKGVNSFLSEFKEAIAEISNKTIKNTQDILKINVNLSEWNKLPNKVKSRLKKQSEIFVNAVLAKYSDGVYFLFQNLTKKTDSRKAIESELKINVSDFIAGGHIGAGASNQSAITVNESQDAIYNLKEAYEKIYAYEFINISPVSAICEELQGQIISKDDPKLDEFRPPLHHNCKSYYQPLIKKPKKEITKINPSKAALKSKKF